MTIDIKELYQELIIDHGTKPRNHCKLLEANHIAEGFNPLCGDQIRLYIIIQDNTILKAAFEGSGCAIATASASIMTEMLIGKTKEEASNLFTKFKQLVTNDGAGSTELGKLLALSSIKNFPSRVKCATLAWHTLDAAIHKNIEITSTE